MVTLLWRPLTFWDTEQIEQLREDEAIDLHKVLVTENNEYKELWDELYDLEDEHDALLEEMWRKKKEIDKKGKEIIELRNKLIKGKGVYN
jgi:predicted  nucleic acid-binding Zn-ribbon protein